jgi:hypothetical protein
MFSRSSLVPTASRVLDFISVSAVLLAFTVYFTGGFRESLPWGRVSITTWIRPLIVALVAAAIRHALQPTPTIFSRLGESMRALRAAAGVRDALPVVLGTRSAVLLIGVLAVALFGYRSETGPPWRLYQNEFLNLPARWDTGWYIGVAAEGYRWDPNRLGEQQNIAFFPAYPLLMRYVSLFFARELMWTGVLISWASFLGALVYLHRFTRDRFGDDAARAAIALLACYPYALFFSTAYTEALFLLTMVAACYHFERDELWKAGVWGLVAGLTRPNGCLLSVVLALIALRPLWRARFQDAADEWRTLAVRMAAAAMPGIGMLLYSGFIYGLTGNPLQWTEQNAAWGRVYRPLDVFVFEQAQMLNPEALASLDPNWSTQTLQLIAVVFMLAAMFPVVRHIGWPYAVMIAINIIPPLSMGGLLSMGRVTSVLFPVFVWLAIRIPAHQRTAWLAVFAMLQALFAALFFTWRPLF